MFSNQKEFNQSLSHFKISLAIFDTIGETTGFMYGNSSDTYSPTNYDNLLIAWAGQTVKPNQYVIFGDIKHTTASTAAKLILTSAPNNWTISDGGLIIEE
jgi:hypothetical protein